jgi:hypothetical protein
MMIKPQGLLLLPLLCASFFLSSASGESVDFQTDLNRFFSAFDVTFTGIVNSNAVKSTDLRQAERLFIREMKKHQAFNTFIRTNSKGSVIAEIIRAEKVDRPMRDVSDQKWFTFVSEKKTSYYSLIKDDERGRYYLFWARPILKQGDRFVGSVLLKIDLWDGFYEFSNTVYQPFLVKLGRKSLFAHKWGDGKGVTEKSITVPGIERISVVYSANNTAAPAAAIAPKDTVVAPPAVAPAAIGDSAKDTTKEKPAAKKKGGGGMLIFFLVLLIAGIVGASVMLIAWMRQRALLKHIDEDDTL